MDNQHELHEQYVQTFTKKEKRGYEIAKGLLGMSFDCLLYTSDAADE